MNCNIILGHKTSKLLVYLGHNMLYFLCTLFFEVYEKASYIMILCNRFYNFHNFDLLQKTKKPVLPLLKRKKQFW